MTPRKIEIDGRRWFQRTYGNTYHTVRAAVNEQVVYVSPLTYGYGNQYAWTARNWLRNAGYLPGIIDHSNGSGEPLWQYCQRVGCELINNVEDVRRQRDLHRHQQEHKARWQSAFKLHGRCEREGRCVEHEIDPTIGACR